MSEERVIMKRYRTRYRRAFCLICKKATQEERLFCDKCRERPVMIRMAYFKKSERWKYENEKE